MLGAAAKKPNTLTTNAADSDENPMKDAFSKYASYLNDLVLSPFRDCYCGASLPIALYIFVNKTIALYKISSLLV